MLNLKEIAQKNASCPLITGKHYQTADIVDTDLHVKAVGQISIDDIPVSVWKFENMDDGYYYGGKALTDILTAWLAEGASLDDVNKALSEQDFHFKLETGKTRKGNSFTNVKILD